MNLHEYQAKKYLASYAVPTLPGEPVLSLDEIDSVLDELDTDVYVVKAQIHAGGRGKGKFAGQKKGGVRVCHSKAEARVNAKTMLGEVLVTKQTGPAGRRVNRLYIEAGAEIAREFYCSLLVNRDTGKVAFITSKQGGMDIEKVAAEQPGAVHTTDIDKMNPATIKKLCATLDIDIKQGKKLFPILYQAFVEADMSLLEINPLAMLASGELCVLDAKISLDDNAEFRHGNIYPALRDISEENEKEIEAAKSGLSYVALDGTIGCMVNGAGLAMATMDIIKLYGGQPANFLDVGGGASKEKVSAAFKIILGDKNVKGILVNIFGGIMRCDTIAEGVVAAIRKSELTVPLVIRLEGTKVNEGKTILKNSGLNILTANDLDDAAQKIVEAIKEDTK